MTTPRDLGWGNPYDLDSGDMVRCNIGAYVGQERLIWLRSADVGTLAAELVRRLVAAGWAGPNPDGAEALDDWGYNGRLKRWAQNAGQVWGSAPMSSVSDHAWGTGLDVNTLANPMLTRRPADMWAHCDLPQQTADIAADLGWDWGGTWSEPWDPQHFGLLLTPDQTRVKAASIRAQRADENGDAMTPAQAALALSILQGLARTVPLIAQRVSDIERRAIVWETRRDEDARQDEARDAVEADAVAKLQAAAAEIQSDLDELSRLGATPAPTA